MSEILDFLRRMNESAGGTMPAWGILLRVTVLLSAALLVALVLRRSSAALRHLVWTLSLVGTLLVPLCSWVLPAWQWAVLPQRKPSPPSVAPVVKDAPPSPVVAPRTEDAFLRSAHSPHPFAARPPLPAAASAGQPVEVPTTPPATIADHPTPPPAPQPKWSWSVFFATAWAVGSFLGLVWLGIGVAAAWHVARRANPTADECWREIVQQVLDPCGIRRPIEVRECPQVSVPMTWGLRRPVILVPAGSEEWPEEIKRSVLLHELGHVRRGDCLMLLLGRLACVAYWFHPLAWLAARQLRKTSEQAADDLVLASHVAPPDYAEHLVGIAARMRGLHLFGHVALPMASPSDLEGRVLAILDPRQNHRSLKRKTCCALMTLALLLVIPCAVLRLGYAQRTSVSGENRQSQEQRTAGKDFSADRTASADSIAGQKSKTARPSSPAAGLDELIRQIRQNEALYRNLDCTVHTVRQYEVSAGGASDTTGGDVSFGSFQPRTTEETDRTVTVGDRLYFAGEDVTSLVSGEKLRGKRTWVFDGSQTVAIEDGNSVTVYQGREEPAQLVPPHCWGIFPLAVNFPLSVYLQGTKAMKACPKVGRFPTERGSVFEFNKVESQLLGEEAIDGLECVKVRVKRWYYTKSPPALQDLWLAKQRNFHVVQCRTSFSEDGKDVPYDATSVTKWREIAKGVWVPEVVQWQDLSPDGPRAKTLGKEMRSLVVQKAVLHLELSKAFFALPQIPAALPRYGIGKDGTLVDSPHHPAPAKAANGTTLASILKRLAEEESRYTPLEILATTQYVHLGGRENLGGGVYTQSTMHERSVVAGDRLFHQEEEKITCADGTTSSLLLREANDGHWSREHTKAVDPPRKPQISASLHFESKDWLRPIRPHTLLFHDGSINSQLLSAYLASGWSDQHNGYSMMVEYVGDEQIDGLHCYKLKCSEGQNGKSFAYWFVWLARDRNLLPLRKEWREPGWSQKLPTGISFVEDLREIRPGQWSPFRAIDLAHQKWDVNGLNAGHILLQWRRDVVVDRATLDPQVGDGLFGSVEVPAGTQVSVQDEHGDSVGEFKQPRTGNLEFSLDKLRAMQHAAETNEDDEYDPKDATTPQRKLRIDAALKVLRRDPPAGQDARIEAAITILRNYLHFQTNTKKWAIAVRELIQIGKPAIPRLLRDLDETDHVADRGEELRALGFVLRGIGDPRAVPALIRALPYTLQPPYSDCGCSVRDRELLRFMQEHDHDHTNGGKHFGIGRPINEVLPALQKLTGIKLVVPGEQGDQEYKDVYSIFRDGSPEQARKQQRHFLQFAERWADWWSKNWKSYVRDEGEAQVEQTKKALQRLSEVAPRPPRATAPAAKDGASNLGPAKAGTTGVAPGDREGTTLPSHSPVAAKEIGTALSVGSRRFELTVLGPDKKPVPRCSIEVRGDVVSTEKCLQSSTSGAKCATCGSWALFQTDANGALVLNLPKKPKRLEVLVEQPRYGPYCAQWQCEERAETIPAQFVAELDAAWSVGGIIVDRQGQPIEGATIRAEIKFKKRPGDTQDLWFGTKATTDAEGKWRFDSVPVSMNAVHVEIDHPNFAPNRPSLPRSEFGIQPGGAPVAKIELQPGITVAGKVTDDAGKPIAGALVRTKFFNDIREAKTDRDGAYRLAGCEPTMVRIVVSAKGRATDMKGVHCAPDMGPLNFAMKPGGKIRVRVLDENGNPAGGARIFFQRWRGQFMYFEFDDVDQYADRNGLWQWNEAPLDEFQADICPPGGMQLPDQRLVARDEEYVFRTHPTLVVSGSVIDAETKKPVKAFRAVPGLRSYDPNARPGKTHIDWARECSYLATEGQYRVPFEREYPAHLLRIEADGYRVAVSRDIKSDEGKVQVDFALVKTKDIAATLLTPDGHAASGAKIAIGIAGSQIMVKNGQIDSRQTYAAQCDADEAGHFRFLAQDGPYQLVIVHPAGFAYLKSAEHEIPGTITLTAWARVEGTFRAGPKPVPNARIEIMSHDIRSYDDGVPTISTECETTTGAGGRFVFDRVFPGDGRIGRGIVRMVNQGATEVTSQTRIAANFPAGKTTHIDLGGSGRLVIGKLAGPAGSNEKVLWQFADIDVQVDLPEPKSPPVPADIDKDPQRREAWWTKWEATREGKAWQAAYDAYDKLRRESPYISATADRDGAFHIDDMPAGDYVLRVHFTEHSAGHLSNYRFTVPPIAGGRSSEPLDLGKLMLEKD